MSKRPSLDELIEDLVKVAGSGDRDALLAAFKRAVSYYPEDEIWRRLSARREYTEGGTTWIWTGTVWDVKPPTSIGEKIVLLAKVRGWCGCRRCRITRAAWEAGAARQTLVDFTAAHAPPDYHVEPWVSLAWIAENGSPMAQRQAKSILVQLRHQLVAEAAE